MQTRLEYVLEDVLKTSWRSLAKTSWRRFRKTYCKYDLKTSKSNLPDILEYVLKTSWKTRNVCWDIASTFTFNQLLTLKQTWWMLMINVVSTLIQRWCVRWSIINIAYPKKNFHKKSMVFQFHLVYRQLDKHIIWGSAGKSRS